MLREFPRVLEGAGWRQHVYGEHSIHDQTLGDKSLRRMHRRQHETRVFKHSHNWNAPVWRSD